MKFTITTAVLQDMLTKSTKCASNDNQRPLTGLIAIQLKDNVLTLITSSATNYLYVHKDKIAGEDFYVVVPVDIFSKLVSKLTAENTTLELKDDTLVVTSGGTYTIGVSIDEEGELTRYPDPYHTSDEFKDYKSYPIKKSTLNLILSVNSASIADGDIAKELPEAYTGYHMSDSIVTTDSIKMCGIDIKVCDEPILVRPETMKLTDVFTEENLEIRISDDSRGNKNIVITSVGNIDCEIVSKLLENMEDFAINAINNLLASNFTSSCAINKVKLAQAIDRLSLFINKLDNFALFLTFTKDGLKLSNKKSNSEEVIPYEASDDFSPYSCILDINALSDQIKAVPGDLVNICYGNEVAVKFEDGNITQMIAIMQ